MCYEGAALMSQNTFPRSNPYLCHTPAFIFQLLKGNSQWGWRKPRRLGNTRAQRRKRLKEQEMVTYSRWRHWKGQNWEVSTWEAGGYWYLNQSFQWSGRNGSSKNGLSEVSMKVRKRPFFLCALINRWSVHFPRLSVTEGTLTITTDRAWLSSDDQRHLPILRPRAWAAHNDLQSLTKGSSATNCEEGSGIPKPCVIVLKPIS